MSILMWLFVIPFAASIIMFFLANASSAALKKLAIALSLLPLAILLYNNELWLGSHIEYLWIPPLSVKFFLATDSLSLLFLYLTALIIPISLVAVKNENNLPHANIYYGLVLLLQGLLIGFFTARDLVLFTIFWEAMLLPLYFIISYWGGYKRQQAALKFLVYMIAGSSLMVAAVLSLYIAAASGEDGISAFDFTTLSKISEQAPYAAWILAVFLIAFAVKTPLFPFHAWLPDAYYEAPTSGTILLSAILSKAGIYGILRIGMELFPTLIKDWSPVMLGLAITGVFYGGLAAWMQKDFKRLIAYSSFSHVNFILVGLFVWNQTAQDGAILQAINHGITIAALFLVIGWLEERLGSTTIGQASGLAKYMPTLCWITLVFVLSSMALPGTNNFVGEILILFGLFSENAWLASFLGLSVILSAMYMLRWMQKVYFETPIGYVDTLRDIKGKEMAVALPLIALILWIGIYPLPILKQIEPVGEKILVEKTS